ncbi:peptidoglycan-recognition protein 3-like [Macrosteles quadrilineatus]|uniref:peptidoglycan-recognition protein 3-like n=1 Tax=Macrosteles quadrilineatus TaxID=74068 RepID=UPI0023E247ED|nr:peptidoglycan-recognition protein 3-like [Macrosteles quadrilineatus]
MPLNIIPRKTWGAIPARKSIPMEHPIMLIAFSIIDPTDIFDMEILKRVQRLHMDSHDHDDIDCSFVIGQDGTVYEGRGWFCQPEKREVEGGNYLDIGFIGDVKGKSIEEHPPLIALTKLLDFASEKRFLDEHYLLISENKDGDCNEDDDNSPDMFMNEFEEIPSPE